MPKIDVAKDDLTYLSMAVEEHFASLSRCPGREAVARTLEVLSKFGRKLNLARRAAYGRGVYEFDFTIKPPPAKDD